MFVTKHRLVSRNISYCETESDSVASSRSQRRWCQDSTNAHFIVLSIFLFPSIVSCFCFTRSREGDVKIQWTGSFHLSSSFFTFNFFVQFFPIPTRLPAMSRWIEAQFVAPHLLFLLRFFGPIFLTNKRGPVISRFNKHTVLPSFVSIYWDSIFPRYIIFLFSIIRAREVSN